MIGCRGLLDRAWPSLEKVVLCVAFLLCCVCIALFVVMATSCATVKHTVFVDKNEDGVADELKVLDHLAPPKPADSEPACQHPTRVASGATAECGGLIIGPSALVVAGKTSKLYKGCQTDYLDMAAGRIAERSECQKIIDTKETAIFEAKKGQERAFCAGLGLGVGGTVLCAILVGVAASR